MSEENLNIIPGINDPPSIAEYTIDGQKFAITRYLSGGKGIEEIITGLAYSQADREFKIDNTKGNTPKDLMS